MMFKIVMAALACALWVCSVILVKKETEARMFREMMGNISIQIVKATKELNEEAEENGED